jgi:hypothetical protein
MTAVNWTSGCRFLSSSLKVALVMGACGSTHQVVVVGIKELGTERKT